MAASTSLPYVTITKLSAFDMLDSMGTNTNIAYQIGGTTAADLPNRDEKVELINVAEMSTAQGPRSRDGALQ